MKNLSNGAKYGIIGVFMVMLLGVGVAVKPWTTINQTERGVLLRFGKVVTIMQPGWNWLNPITEKVVDVDVTQQKVTAPASASSSDLQNVSTKVVVNYQRNPNKVDYLYSEYNMDEAERVIAPAIQEAVKAATARFTAEQLITRRADVKDLIQQALASRLEKIGCDDVVVQITDFKFSQSFDEAIEAKVTAEQNALAAKNKLEQVKYEAEQTVTKAKAKAEAIQIQAKAITQQGGANYVQLQAIEQWDGKLPAQMIPGGTLPFLNLSK